MSTLQISLAIVGGLVLAGVVAYNAWITRRSAPRTARELPEGHPPADAPVVGEPLVDDSAALPVAPSGERIEPVLHDEPVAAVSVPRRRCGGARGGGHAQPRGDHARKRPVWTR
jgi:hypothetical protein